MKKKFRLSIVILVILFGLIQFFQPEKNTGTIGADHLFNQVAVPSEIQDILKNSCADCHSNQTRYLWYDNIAPASWLVSNHVKDGKKHLNISEWGKASEIDKVTFLDNIVTEVEEGRMPMKSYTLLHREARLNDKQKADLIAWADKLAGSLVEQKKEN